MKKKTKDQIMLNKRDQGKKRIEKAVVTTAFSEIIIMIISIFSFSFIIGGMVILETPEVKAEDYIPQGCCEETNSGAICQNVNVLDKSECKKELISTDCNTLDQCRIGCCYDPEGGSCSLNSPKNKCLSNGGNWSSNAQCNIPQCQLGCCVLGDQASTTTAKECSLKSQELNFQTNFKPLDATGTCDYLTNLEVKGACLTEARDYSGKNECKFTTKSSCKTGEFKEGLLCTAKELNTVCKPAKNTTCVEGKDEVYYLDSCGNTANVYDASKFDNEEYWKVITKSTCSASDSKNCGNCDYVSGSKCYSVREGRDTKPTYGNNVCRNLNCVNGKKHGESWCISDYKNTNVFGISPVGSRWFRGICLDGEISIEPCADFNNEICISNTDSNSKRTEAKCQINEWRSCIAANEKETYSEVERECKKYSQCAMIDTLIGEDNLKNQDGELFPGFKKNVPNIEQGSAGSVGKDMNKVIAHCVPKYPGGMVFWPTNTKTSSISSSPASSGKIESPGNQYGGSIEETKAICALGSFTCTSHKAKDGAFGDWKWKDNQECADSESQDYQKWLQAMNERCRSLGPCGLTINVAGELGSNSAKNISLSQISINPDGKMSEPYTPEKAQLSEDYLSSIKGKAGLIKAGSLSSLTAAVILDWITGKATDSSQISSEPQNEQDLQKAASEASDAAPSGPMNYMTSATMGIGSLLMAVNYAGTLWISTTSMSYAAIGSASSAPTFLGTVGWAAAAAIAGYMVGQIIGKAFGMGKAETQSLSYALAAGAGASVLLFASKGLAMCSGGPLACVIGIIIAILIIIFTYVFTYKADRYWVTTYSCEPWEPPTQGKCEACNNDVRACSEYRCRSLGSNCHYFIENGEPGYCATMNEIWSAKITPWKEIITEGNTYSDIKDNGFSIQGSLSSGKVQPWEPLEFGITTDKPASCRLDTKHTNSFEEMQFAMATDSASLGCNTGNCPSQGTNHKIVLSPHIGNSSGGGTPGLTQNSENNYYIRCKNFAGQTNEAEFAVKIITGEGKDLTPPIIKQFIPASSSYLNQGANSTNLIVYVNEPSECKYSRDVNNRYEDMTGNMTCLTDPEAGILGLWPCFTSLKDLKIGQNKLFLQCQDQPNIDERISNQRNINRNSKEYSINVCSTGLNITSISPQEQIVTGRSPVSADIEVTTSGCIENGKSICTYKFGNSSYIDFFTTNSIKHKQTFTDLASGLHNISIRCEDQAGNFDQKNIIVNVFLDNYEPIVTRSYQGSNKLVLITDEESTCKYVSNASIGCNFDFFNDNSTLMEGTSLVHTTFWGSGRNYYFKCSDSYNNTNSQCAMILKAY